MIKIYYDTVTTKTMQTKLNLPQFEQDVIIS